MLETITQVLPGRVPSVVDTANDLTKASPCHSNLRSHRRFGSVDLEVLEASHAGQHLLGLRQDPRGVTENLESTLDMRINPQDEPGSNEQDQPSQRGSKEE